VARSPTVMARPQLTLAGYDLIDMGCVAVTVAVMVAVATNERNAFRAVVAVAFALYVPGRAIVSNWTGLATRPHLALSILFSLSILTLVATLTLWAGYWHPRGLLEVEGAVVEVALFTAVLRRRRAQHLPGVMDREAESADHPSELDS
jgi:uncharacterized membrane protein